MVAFTDCANSYEADIPETMPRGQWGRTYNVISRCANTLPQQPPFFQIYSCGSETYCLMPPKSNASTASNKPKPEILQAPPMPDEFSWLIQRFIDRGIFSDKERPQYCIVNEYVGSQGIAAHTENFAFGEPVVGLSLLRACPIRFHELAKPFDGSVRSGKARKAERTGRRVDVQMPRRSLLVMRGQSRWQWQHEIVKSEKGRGEGRKRVSLTFRHKTETTV